MSDDGHGQANPAPGPAAEQPSAPPAIPVPAAPPPHLPDGFRITLNRRVRVADGGRSLIGGSPTRVLYLTGRAAAMFHDRALTVSDDGSRALADRLLDAAMADPIVDSLPDFPDGHVTYVVPVFGRPEALDRLLASMGPGRKVIVVDDVSPDRSAIASVASKHGARFVPLDRNGGPALARNVGLSLVTTPFVAFVDSDIVLDPLATPMLLRHFADPLVALAAPRVLGLRKEQAGPRSERTPSTAASGLNWIGRYEESRSSLDLGTYPATVRPRSPVSWVPGAFLIARVSAIGSGFSAEMREGEDVDFVWRLAEAGWRIRFEPAAKVWHEHRQDVRDWLQRKAFYGSSAHPLSVRHPHDIAPAVFAPWSVGVIAALLAQRRWSVPLALGISVFAGARIARKLSRSEHPLEVAARLTASGVGASLTQTIALFVRHWWPLALVGSLLSRRIRRALAAAAVIDAAIEYRRVAPELDPIRFGIARRLDDIAYGAGVWFSAMKGRSLRALLPDIRRR